jgi:hypothetical protein
VQKGTNWYKQWPREWLQHVFSFYIWQCLVNAADAAIVR